jgi:glucosamine--fructose-6-phosphate aminotransferase (isomerizing)
MLTRCPGGKTDENAHPHSDSNFNVAVVHNGTIMNTNELRKQLRAEGKTFKSETDTELIAIMLGSYVDEGMELLEAVRKTVSRLEGTWGLCIIDKRNPDRIIAARNGSPLVVGIGDGRMFVASEHTAFRRHTSQVPSRHHRRLWSL